MKRRFHFTAKSKSLQNLVGSLNGLVMNRKRLVVAGLLCASCCTPTGMLSAHHPDRESHPVTPRIDVIGPLGNHFKPGYRRAYNRPRYWTGRIAYKIAPSSQEAMAWHRAEHAGAYQAPKKCTRLEQHYFYPKPWQQLRVGPRSSTATSSDEFTPINEPETFSERLGEVKTIEELTPAAPESTGMELEFPETQTTPLDESALSEP